MASKPKPVNETPPPLTHDERMRVEAFTKSESNGRHFNWTPEEIRKVMEAQ